MIWINLAPGHYRCCIDFPLLKILLPQQRTDSLLKMEILQSCTNPWLCRWRHMTCKTQVTYTGLPTPGKWLQRVFSISVFFFQNLPKFCYFHVKHERNPDKFQYLISNSWKFPEQPSDFLNKILKFSNSWQPCIQLEVYDCTTQDNTKMKTYD